MHQTWEDLQNIAAQPVNSGGEQVSPPGPDQPVTPTAKALQNLGNGNYRLNWKTDKKTTGCKLMRLSLASEGPITHDALFNFK